MAVDAEQGAAAEIIPEFQRQREYGVGIGADGQNCKDGILLLSQN